MPRSKKRAGLAPKMGKPKILIVDDNGIFRLYKQWTRNKLSQEPFFITDSIPDLLENYEIYIRQWGIKPDIALINKLVLKYHKDESHDGISTSFLKGHQ